ncbi:MAG: DUF3311 domain-containing protein [Alphaproteobacteria bacterium]|nr:DUF3311 domain-containing protein [Alphaproteobacteria bacterium]MDE2109605.1 DUF3311 domain-containing protein [Alphaproteobacteria bacterium]MDE2493025.1 DUF3311 domain-containing protein [Alphaproteobacteria bacterium]
MAGKSHGRLRPYHLLLLLPLFSLWVPFYNRIDPTLAGIPFFYWFQMAWIGVTVLALLIVYLLERRSGDKL